MIMVSIMRAAVWVSASTRTQHLGILDRGPVFERVKVDAAPAFDDMQRVRLHVIVSHP